MEIPAEMSLEQIKKYHSRVPDPDEKERLCVRIERGPFAGIDVAYGRFQLSDKYSPAAEDNSKNNVNFYHFVLTDEDRKGLFHKIKDKYHLIQILLDFTQPIATFLSIYYTFNFVKDYYYYFIIIIIIIIFIIII